MKKKILMLVLCLGGAGILTWLRVYHMTYFIEPLNGFYYPIYSSSGIILGVCVAVLLAAFALVGAFDKKLPGRPRGRSPVLGAFTFFYASYILLCGLKLYADIENARTLITCMTYIVFAIFMLSYSLCLFMEKRISPMVSFVPVVFFAWRLAMHFLDSFKIINSSEVVINIITLVCCVLFFNAFGKYIAGIKFKKTRKLFYIFGACAVAMCIISAAPGLIIKQFITDVPARIFSSETNFDLVTGLYVLVYMVMSFAHKTCYRDEYCKKLDVYENSYERREFEQVPIKSLLKDDKD